MSQHFHKEMEHLHRNILAMCSSVEENINEAVNGLKNRSSGLAEELKIRDREVNDLDVRIEEECLKILALYNPVANDLRRVCSVLKIIGELERVGDLAVSIAERSAAIAVHPSFPLPMRLSEISRESLTMLHDSIDSYVELDADKARSVIVHDDVVDELNVELLNELRVTMAGDPAHVDPGMHIFSAIRHIERVADHATNIAEDVVYLINGEIIRHRQI
ncbi:MAG: phosphate signaling complex protein PhoU [Planctomycetaceae bacterium]|nr:phosphate signaling complex protein PhoU [Planctomycetaceae bacterium]